MDNLDKDTGSLVGEERKNDDFMETDGDRVVREQERRFANNARERYVVTTTTCSRGGHFETSFFLFVFYSSLSPLLGSFFKYLTHKIISVFSRGI